MQIEVVDSQKTLGQRVQAYLRWRFGRDAAKHAAAITGADLRTASGWVSEAREPKGEALLAIITDMGREGLLALFSPEVETHAVKIEREIHAHRQEIARLESRLGAGGPTPAPAIAEIARQPEATQRTRPDRLRGSGA